MDTLLQQLAAARAEPGAEKRLRIPRRIAYVAGHGLPYCRDGHALRTHGIAAALAASGFQVLVFTRPGSPWNLPGFADPAFANQHHLDGVRYIHPAGAGGAGRPAAEDYGELFRVFKPSAVVAAADHETALPALLAARRLGLPFVYEARGLWETPRPGREPPAQDSAEFARQARMEAELAKAADRVAASSRAVREDLVRRGVAPDAIDLVPSAVRALPGQRPRDPALASKLGLGEGPVVAYLGSLGACEGLDDLARACGLLRRRGLAAQLLVVGGEPAGAGGFAEALRKTALESGLAGHFALAGPVGHDQVGQYYALADVVAVPRRPGPAAELAAPLKAVEALAHGRPLVASDLAPLAELVAESGAGRTFAKGSIDALADALAAALAEDARAGSDFAERARAWVGANRTWEQAVRPLAAALLGGESPAAAPTATGIELLSILDEISHASWGQEFKLSPLDRQGYAGQIAGAGARAVFIESCWKGNNASWEYAFTSPGLKHANAQALLEALALCKARKLPIIFWNKEDPMHYERFLPIARQCDIILTTDSNKIADYRRDLPGAKVAVMPFAASPRLCNPEGRFAKKAGTICFAGSYYAAGHDERKAQMDALLPVIPAFGGAIYDRMSKLENERYTYPGQYRPFIRKAVPFTEVVNVYKQFKLFLNVNTITTSPTMMSRRVYELLACGTPVVSAPSRALEEQFPGIVQTASDADEAKAVCQRLLSDHWEWLRLSHRGYREVMLKHTYQQRAGLVLESLGIPAARRPPLVSVVMATMRPHFIDRIATNIGRQSHREIELVIVTQNYSAADAARLKESLARKAGALRRLLVIEDDSKATLGARLNRAVAETRGEYVAKMDDDDLYFPNYLQDMLIPFTFGDYGIVGKGEFFVYLEGHDKTVLRFQGNRHRLRNLVSGATFVIKREVLSKAAFADLNRGEDSGLLEAASRWGFKIYAADPFNFVLWRSKATAAHTWQVDHEFFMESSVEVGGGIPEEIIAL